MQVLPRSFLRLLSSSPNVSAAPAPSRRLFYHLSAPALSRRVCPPTEAPNAPARHVSRYWNMVSGVGVKGAELVKPDGRLLVPSANDIMIFQEEHTNKKLIPCHGDGGPAHGDENDAFRATVEVTGSKHDTSEEIMDTSDSEEEMMRIGQKDFDVEGVYPLYTLPESRHRDGSIYRDTRCWQRSFYVEDRSETRLEAMKLSDPSNCRLRADGTCMSHPPGSMLQFFSLKLAKLYVEGGSVEVYGYIAARDGLDPLLNYFINLSRDDPIIVEQGSVINMAGPKRGIELVDDTLIEYDIRIKKGKQREDDLQLIDGVSVIGGYTPECHAFKARIRGECGAIDIMLSHISNAVEATVEVLISEVYSSFNLCLSCFTSGLHEEIQLFDGVIGESRGLKRSVVAVRMGTTLDLKFTVGSGSFISADHSCSFRANQHGCDGQEIKNDLALISVKVTWSTLPLDCGGI